MSSKLNKNLDPSVLGPSKSHGPNYEETCDEDMTCNTISVTDHNNDNGINSGNNDNNRFSDCLSSFRDGKDLFSDAHDNSSFDGLPAELHQWVVQSGVTQNAADILLKILNKYSSTLPKCSRTLRILRIIALKQRRTAVTN